MALLKNPASNIKLFTYVGVSLIALVTLGVNLKDTFSNYVCISTNIRNELINNDNNQNYTDIKTQLNSILDTELSTVSMSSIYYTLSKAPCDIVISSVVLGSQVSSNIVVGNIEPVDPNNPVPAQPATVESTEPITGTEAPASTTTLVTENTIAIGSNPPVSITIRTDNVPELLAYLDTTMLNYLVTNYESNDTTTITIKIKR